MKKMLLIGGIISTVLPAMATDLDLSDYHLVSGENNTCEGPAGYTGFTTGTVNMTPLYIQECPAGSYLNITNNTTVQQHQTGNTLDYYYVDACTQCVSGQYSPGVSNPAPDANGVLSSTVPGNCSTDTNGEYTLSDGHGRANGVPESINDCYKVCNNSSISNQTLAGLHASAAHYIGGDANTGKAYYGEQCTMQIDTCAAGYDLLDLATGGDFETENSAWTLEKSRRSYEGTFSCNDTACSITFGSNTVPVATYADNATCLTSCGSQANVAAAIASVANGGVLTDGTAFCAAKIVDITWTGVADPEDAATCTYGEGLSAPTPDSVPTGYEFVGWTVGYEPAPVVPSEPEEPGNNEPEEPGQGDQP